MQKLNNDALLVQPCPVHGRKPELYGSAAGMKLRCPVPGCVCEGDIAPTRDLAADEWDALAFELAGHDGTPVFPLLELESPPRESNYEDEGELE